MAIAKLSIDLEAKLANLQAGMDKAGMIAERSSARMSRAFSGVKTAAIGIGAAIGAAVSVREITDFVKGAIDGADALSKQARSVGMLTEELSALSYASDLAGVNQEELVTALTKMSKQARDAGDGVKASADAFRNLGISVKNNDGTLKGSNALLAEVADSFAALPAGIQKTALATDLFGRSGAKMISLLDGGSSGLETMRIEAERLGIVIGSDFAKASEELNDNLSRLQKQSEALAITLASVVVPKINEVVVRINAAAASFGGLGEFLRLSLSATPFDDAADGVSHYGRQIKTLTQELETLKKSGGLLDSLQISGKQRELADARKLLEFYERTASSLGKLGAGQGRGSINPPFALKVQAGVETPKPSKPGKASAPYAAPIDPAMQSALDAIEQTDVSKIAALNAQLDQLFSLRATGLFGSEVDQAIENVRANLEALDPAAQQAAKETSRLSAILAQTPGGQLKSALADVEFLNAQFDKGKLSAEQWAQSVIVATEAIRTGAETVKEMDDRTKLALDNIQSAIGDTLVSSLKGDFDGILDMWADLLLRMVAEAAAADIASALGLGGAKNSGGNLASLLGAFGSFFGGGKAIGGAVQRGRMFPVNELGGPGELFSAGGKQYLMPSVDGLVTPTAQRPGYYGGAAPAGQSIVIQNRPVIHMDASMDQARTTQMVMAGMAQTEAHMWKQLRARGLA
jgi:hypothetical protein